MDPLEARIQQMIDAGKSEAEITAMLPHMEAEIASPEGGGRQELGPTPAGSPPPDAYPFPANRAEAIQQSRPGLLARAADAVIQGGKNLRDFPGKFAQNPGQGIRAMAEGAAQAMMLPASGQLANDVDARAGRYQAGTQTLQDDMSGMSAHGLPPGYHRTDASDPRLRENAAAAEAQPGAAIFGGSVAPSPEMLLTAGLSKVLPIPGGILGRVARSAGIAGGVGAASGTGRALARGEALPDALEAGAVGGLSAAPLAAATTGLGEAARGIRGAIANSKGGQARQLIESQGGNVGPLSSGDQGPFAEGQPLAGLPTDDAGKAQAARASAVNILKRNASDLQGELKGPLAEKAQLDATNKGHVVVNDLVAEMQKLRAGELLSDGEQSTVGGWLRRLDKHAVMVNGEPSGVYAMTPKALNEFRTMLDKATSAGETPGSVAAGKMQGVAGVARALVGDTDYGPVNEKIHEANNKSEALRRLLSLEDKPAGGRRTPEDLPASEVNRVTQMMSRQGHKTNTAGGQNYSLGDGGGESAPEVTPQQARANLDKIVEQYPQHTRDVRMPQVLDAKGELGFRLLPRSDSGGLGGRLKSAAPGAIAGLLAGGGSAMATNPAAAALIAAATMGTANSWPAITGRLMYTPAMLGGALGEGMSAAAPYTGALVPMLTNPLDAMGQAKRKRKEKR